MTVQPTRVVPVATPHSLAGVVRDGLAGRTFESAVDVAVCEDGRLVGLVPIEHLLAAGADTPLGALVQPPATVPPDTDAEPAATMLARAGGRSLAVVDDRGRFVGLVPPDRTLAVLRREHDEDLARLGGFLARSSMARTAAEEPVPRRLWHRLPWLAVGLLGAMASAAMVSAFEEQLERQLLLALFVPAVVYMADAVGTQTEAVVIRGLSVGVVARDVVLRELVTGLVVGALIATAFIPFAYVA